MLREVMDVLEFLDDARNGAEPFAALLSDGPQSVEITPFESDIGKTDFPGFAGQIIGQDRGHVRDPNYGCARTRTI